MSYIRAGSPYKYVQGNISGDYVYQNESKHIVDYGGISDDTLVEFVCKICDLFGKEYKFDKPFSDYVKIKVAERLDVKLRKKPLTDDQIVEIVIKR